MRKLHLDAFCGISGDMTIGTLLDLSMVSIEELRAELSKLQLDDEFEISAEKVIKNGITATKFHVLDKNNAKTVEHHHTHCHEDHHHDHCHEDHHHDHATTHSHGRNYGEIENIIKSSEISPNAKEISLKIFYEIAVCEGIVHGKPAKEVGFHEVGAIDSVVDIVGTAILLDKMQIEEITFGKVSTGSGTVRCAHGIMPVPAPATQLLLEGMQSTSTEVEMELATPTGVAILKAIGKQKLSLDIMGEKVGYGAGSKTFQTRANVLKATLYRDEEQDVKQDPILEIETNIDDERGEVLGYLLEKLIKIGALDVFYSPIYMKKNRPAYKLTVLCKKRDKDRMIAEIFNQSTTIGVRYHQMERETLAREEFSFFCGEDEIFAKANQQGRVKIEFESISKYAESNDISIYESEEILKKQIIKEEV